MQNNVYKLDNHFSCEDIGWLQKNLKQYEQHKNFGTFIDDQHYLITLKLLLSSTNETTNRIHFFSEHIIPHTKFGHILDIGIGDGLLAKTFGNKFTNITLIDPSHEALACVQPSDFTHRTALTKIAEPIQNVALNDESIDLALLSHTLYYIDEEQWFNVVKSVFKALRPDGVMVIVLNGGLDKEKLAKEFNGNTINIEALAADCSNGLNANSIKLVYHPESFTSHSLEMMRHIVGLHLYDVKATATKEQLKDFLKNNIKNSLYQFHIYQKFMIITK